MINANLLDFSKFTGHLVTLDKKQVLEVNEIVFDMDSLKKIADATQNGGVGKDNQQIFVKSITISKDQVDAFTQGQHSLKELEEGHFVATTKSRSPKHFYANLEGNATKNESSIGCHLVLGSISFDLKDAVSETSSDYMTYKNVEAMLYNFGTYGCDFEFIDSEDDESI